MTCNSFIILRHPPETGRYGRGQTQERHPPALDAPRCQQQLRALQLQTQDRDMATPSSKPPPDSPVDRGQSIPPTTTGFDVTELCRLAASALGPNEMIHDPDFSLYGAMSALELMDAKMDKPPPALEVWCSSSTACCCYHISIFSFPYLLAPYKLPG